MSSPLSNCWCRLHNQEMSATCLIGDSIDLMIRFSHPDGSGCKTVMSERTCNVVTVQSSDYSVNIMSACSYDALSLYQYWSRRLFRFWRFGRFASVYVYHKHIFIWLQISQVSRHERREASGRFQSCLFTAGLQFRSLQDKRCVGKLTEDAKVESAKLEFHTKHKMLHTTCGGDELRQ